MTQIDHAQLFAAIKAIKLRGPGPLTQAEVDTVNRILSPTAPTTVVKPAVRLTIATLHDRIGITPDTPGYGVTFGPKSKAALSAKISNVRAPRIGEADFKRIGDSLGVETWVMRAVRLVEAPRGAFDPQGRPTHLYERHVMARNSEPPGRFNKSHPLLSGGPYGKGGYGTLSSQFDKLASACALDPEAAFEACSWGAFQVLGENAVALGYASAFDMVLTLCESEAAHLECFARFVRVNGLEDELSAGRPGDPDSWIPFVSRYNGSGFRQFNYHVMIADAALKARG